MSGLNTVLQRTELLKSVAVFAPVPEPVAAFERARNMADDKTKKARDRNRIDVYEHYELRYRTNKFGVR